PIRGANRRRGGDRRPRRPARRRGRPRRHAGAAVSPATIVPGAVSRALADVWTGAPRDLTVDARYPHAVYLRVGGTRPLPVDEEAGFTGRSRALPPRGSLRIPAMLSLVTSDGVHQPGSIVLGRRAADEPLRGVE